MTSLCVKASSDLDVYLMMVLHRYKWKFIKMIIIVICLPLFQFLMSVENDKAIMQFVFNPHIYETGPRGPKHYIFGD